VKWLIEKGVSNSKKMGKNVGGATPPKNTPGFDWEATALGAHRVNIILMWVQHLTPTPTYAHARIKE